MEEPRQEFEGELDIIVTVAGINEEEILDQDILVATQVIIQMEFILPKLISNMWDSKIFL